MKRRTILVAAGSSVPLALGGCLGIDTQSDGSETNNSGDTTETNESQSENGETSTKFPNESCPPYDTDAENFVCSHTVNEDAAPLFMAASPTKSELDGDEPSEEITLTLHNQSSSGVEFNPYSWHIWHKRDAGWQQLEEETSGNGKTTVDAGDTASWTFMDALTYTQIEPELTTGRYAAEIQVPSPNDGETTAYIALVELSAPE